jgi:hypothetical protein
MSEHEEIRITGEVERDGPISVGRDRFGHVFCTKLKFDLSDGFRSLIVSRSGIESRKDVVKVDGLSLYEIKPLGVREGGASRCIDNAGFDLLGIN